MNRFGQFLAVPIVALAAAALVAGAFRVFDLAYGWGACALVLLLAQHQWGRRAPQEPKAPRSAS